MRLLCLRHIKYVRLLRTYKQRAQQFYWPFTFCSIQEYVNKCETCQCTKAATATLKPTSLLQPLLIPCQVWEDITLDFIEELPCSQGKNTKLVVVDRLSKSAHFMALSHPFLAKTVAELFVEGIVKLHDYRNQLLVTETPFL